MKAEEDLHDRFELFVGAKGEVIADLQLGVQKFDEFLGVVLPFEDLLAQVGLLTLHVIHLTNYKIFRIGYNFTR